MAKKPLKVSSESLVFEKIPEGIYPIYESDWNRLKGMTGNIKTPRKWCSIIGSAMLGVAGSSLIQLVYNYTKLQENEKWDDHIMLMVFLLSLLFGICLFIVDKERNDNIASAGKMIHDEMALIEKKYKNPVEDASIHSKQSLSTVSDTTHDKTHRARIFTYNR